MSYDRVRQNSGSLIPGSHQEDAGCRLGRPSRICDESDAHLNLGWVPLRCNAIGDSLQVNVNVDAIASFVLRLGSSGTAEELPMDSLFHCVITRDARRSPLPIVACVISVDQV